MTSTQQNEAMQAVRLLFVAACGGGSSDHKNPETLYRARRVLEEFIESAAVLESADDDEDMTYPRSTFEYQGNTYRVGEYIRTRLDDILSDGLILSFDDREGHEAAWIIINNSLQKRDDMWDVHYRNQNGSFKK